MKCCFLIVLYCLNTQYGIFSIPGTIFDTPTLPKMHRSVKSIPGFILPFSKRRKAADQEAKSRKLKFFVHISLNSQLQEFFYVRNQLCIVQKWAAL